MIKNIIFDLGDVFIDINEKNSYQELKKIGLDKFTDEMLYVNKQFEIGHITTEEFLKFYKKQFSSISEEELIKIWNSVLIDFPNHRLSFLKRIKEDFTIFLLSNTNKLHINYFKEQVGYDFYSRFENCFEKVYYSYEINLRKPELEIFEYVLEKNGLKAEETLFIDDKIENTNAAQQLGMHIWKLDPQTEDVIDFFEKFPSLDKTIEII